MISISNGKGNGFLLEDKRNGFSLLLDPARADGLTAVSHAHTDHLPSSGSGPAIATAETLAFAEARTGRALEPASHPAVTLHNAGHMIGSAMVEVATSAGTVLYTGDLNTQDRLFLRGARPLKCDVLILDGTYADSSHSFPPFSDIARQAAEFLARNGRAVFYGYSYGKAQLLTALATELGFPAIAQAEVYKANKLAASFGHDLGPFELLGSPSAKERVKKDAVVVAPTYLARTAFSSSLAKQGFAQAVFTGWPSGDFPLSDHCDFASLLEFVKGCDPAEIVIAHAKKGCDLPAALREIGYRAKLADNRSSFVF